jgi:hypothetical protein
MRKLFPCEMTCVDIKAQRVSTTIHVSFLCWLLVFTAVFSDVHADETEQQAEGDNSIELVFAYDNVISIQRLDHQQAAIKIDGHLDEPAWATPPVLDQFIVTKPDTLVIPPYQTEFRMFYTDKGIYASFDLEQPADTIIMRYAARDDFGVTRDNVSLTLDTSGEGLYGYFMNLSLGDVQMDGTVKPERRYSKRWDGAWYGATQLTEKGWSAEYFIPWSQMAMPRVSGVRRIGISIKRKVAHLDEDWSWPPLPRSQPKFLSSLQPLAFDSINPRRQWSLFPFTSLRYDHVDNDFDFKAGLDLFWRPSSNFQLTATVNPDFGTVEADDVVVNLTANETFFPEKRLFFLEGQDIFNTNPRSEAEYGPKVVLVNTRRIGGRPNLPDLPDDEEFPPREELQLAELLGAAKVTGQIGSFRYGLLAAQEEDTDYMKDNDIYVQDGRGFGVVRLLYEDSHGAAYRALGFISTVVRHPEYGAIVHGVDFHRLSTDGHWDINGQLLYSDTDEEGIGYGAFTDIEYAPRQGLKHSLQLTWYDDQIDINDLGYLARNDTREVRYFSEWVQSGLIKIRDSNLGTFMGYAENNQGFNTDAMIGVYANVTLNNLHSIDAFGWYSPSHYDDRNSFDNGTFKVAASTNVHFSYRTDAAKKISFSGKFVHEGETLGGHAYQLGAGLSWRPTHNVTLNAELNYRQSDGWLLHQDDEYFTSFDATEWRPELRFDFFATAKQHFRLVLQWDGIRARENEFYTLEEGSTQLIPGPKPPGETDDFSISELAFQIRYRWQIAPLSDLYVVYTKGDSRDTDLMGFGDLFRESWRYPLGDQLVIKLRYRLGS